MKRIYQNALRALMAAMLILGAFLVPSSRVERSVQLDLDAGGAMIVAAGTVQTAPTPPAADEVAAANAPPITPAPKVTPIPMPAAGTVLERGAQGEDVRRMQLRLIQLGYLAGAADGGYDSATAEAVRTFQQMNALPSDGIAGAVTLRELFNQDTVLDAYGSLYSAGSAPYVDEAGIVHLCMTNFAYGSAPLAAGYGEGRYEDESISVSLRREEINGSVFNSVEVRIAHASQLRTALAGTIRNPALTRFSRLAARVQSVIAINGDYYENRDGGFIVRQGHIISASTASALDGLIIDYEGNLHIFRGDEVNEAIAAHAGNIYQAFCFGPALVIDGALQEMPEDYSFAIHSNNPRTALGQLGPLHYLIVVVDGRTDYSLGAMTAEVARFMYDAGCQQAFNLDGGASSSMYYQGAVYNHLTDNGERSMYDILYFASTAAMDLNGEG